MSEVLIQRRREELQRMAETYRKALSEVTVEEMIETLSDVYAFCLLPHGSQPHEAAKALGMVEGMVYAWYKRHQIIQQYHQRQQELIAMETRGDGRG